MFRYSLFLLAICGSVATAIAAITPASVEPEAFSRNVTVIEKNQAFPQLGPLVVDECLNEDCSETYVSI
jgi:hypothetical protein